MKGFFGLSVVAILVLSAQAQTSLNITQSLQAQQVDLALTHEFIETAIALNRGQLSAAMNLINFAVADSHIDSFAFIREIALNVSAEIDLVEVNPRNDVCINSLINRWGLQVSRFGILLSNCIAAAHQFLAEKNQALNQIHVEAQRSKFVQNVGFRVFSETSDYTGTDDLAAIINREHRNAFSNFLTYRERFENFVSEVEETYRESIEQLVACDRILEEDFVREQEIHLGHLMRCNSM